MTNGRGLNTACRARPAIPAIRPRTTGYLSMRCCGSCEQGIRGESPAALGNGHRTFVRVACWRDSGGSIRDRHLIERFFARLKHFRRIATRSDKLAKPFLAFIHLAGAFIWRA